MNPTAPLELRPIQHESLDDGEAELPHADEGPKPPRRGLFRVNYAAKLEKALAELSKIEQRRKELLQWDKAEEQAANELLNELQSELNAVDVPREGDLDAFRKGYRISLRKNLELSPLIESLRKWIGGLSRQNTLARADDPGSIAKLKAEFPTMKPLLVDAICAKAGQLKGEADRIAKEEQKRLNDVYGVGEYEAEETQVVKRARASSEYLERLVQRATTEPAESLYLDVVRSLLQ